MTVLQIILILFIVFASLRTVYRFRKHEISVREFVVWILLWILAALATLMPQSADIIARKVGLATGRGVDLAVYSSIPLLFYIIFRLFAKVDRIEKQLTKIVRRQALMGERLDNKKNHE